jgi:hypothetical protein
MEIVMFNKEQKILVKEFLQSVVNEDLSVLSYKKCGICHNISELLDNLNGYDFVEQNCADWKHSSGCRVNPIRRKFTKYPIKLWEGEQLKLRQSLCAHLLTKLE